MLFIRTVAGRQADAPAVPPRGRAPHPRARAQRTPSLGSPRVVPSSAHTHQNVIATSCFTRMRIVPERVRINQMLITRGCPLRDRGSATEGRGDATASPSPRRRDHGNNNYNIYNKLNNNPTPPPRTQHTFVPNSKDTLPKVNKHPTRQAWNT